MIRAESRVPQTSQTIGGLADLKALGWAYPLRTVDTRYRSAVGDGGGGTWDFMAGDQSVFVAADPDEGVWVTSTGIPATQGAWKRRMADNYLDARWWPLETAVQAVDGSWSGADMTTTLLNLTTFASAYGYSIRAYETTSIVSGQIMNVAKVFSGFQWLGGRIVTKVGAQGATFRLFAANPADMQTNGVTTNNPTYYFTAPVATGDVIAEVNTVSGITVGSYVQFLDRANRMSFFDSTLSGIQTASACLGQSVRIDAIDNGANRDFTVRNGEYTSSSGVVRLVMTENINFPQGTSVTVSALTGTGAFVSLNGTYSSIGAAGYPYISFYGTSGLGTITITGGTVTYTGDATQRIIFNPGCEFPYSGTAVSPNTASTCLRRFPYVCENVLFKDLEITSDKTAPQGAETQILLYLACNIGIKVRDCTFDWYGRAINLNNALNYEVSNNVFTGGSDESYILNIGSGSYNGLICDNYSQGGRHFTQGTASSNDMAPAHIRISRNRCFGHYFAAIGTHGAQRDCLIDGNTIVGSPYASTGDGIQLRGTRVKAVNNDIYACKYGIESAHGVDCVIEGGTITNCQDGIRNIRTRGLKIINKPFIKGSQNSHVKVRNDEYLTTLGQMPGLVIDVKTEGNLFLYSVSSGTYVDGTGVVTLTLNKAINFDVGASIVVSTLAGTGAFASLNGSYATASGAAGQTIITYVAAAGLGATTITSGYVSYTQEPLYGDLKWLTVAPATPIVLLSDTRISIDAGDRAPIATTFDEDDTTPASVALPTEYYTGISAPKTAAFGIVTRMDTAPIHLMNPTAGNVRGTLPTTVGRDGARAIIKNITTGTGNVADIGVFAAETIDGAAAPYVVPDMGSVELVCRNGAWWVV